MDLFLLVVARTVVLIYFIRNALNKVFSSDGLPQKSTGTSTTRRLLLMGNCTSAEYGPWTHRCLDLWRPRKHAMHSNMWEARLWNGAEAETSSTLCVRGGALMHLRSRRAYVGPHFGLGVVHWWLLCRSPVCKIRAHNKDHPSYLFWKLSWAGVGRG